jgi:GDP-L-fucose synthase
MNVDKMKAAGWEASIDLEEGIKTTYKWFFENQNKYKQVKL